MIRIENAVFPSPDQLEFVTIAIRNPYASWGKSDSKMKRYWFEVGEADLDLMARLSRAGDDHGKYLRMLPVMCEIIAPTFWLFQLDTYKVGTVSNSCSKMHNIQSKPFDLADFYHDRMEESGISKLCDVIEELNWQRDMFNKTKDFVYWYGIMNLLPQSYMQRRSWTANYQTLKHIYHGRKNHRLDGWHEFCRWVENKVPYAKELIICEETNENQK